MSEFSGTIWPPLSIAYDDEFGHIELDVYQAAGTLWKVGGERFAVSTLGDAAAGLRLMLKATAIVSRKKVQPGNPIANLPAYLFQIYKHLVLADLEKEHLHGQRELKRQTEIECGSAALVADEDRKILIHQLMQHMDGWMRNIFELLVLGHTFEEIGRLRRQNPHVLRSKFNKHLNRLRKQIRC